MATKACLTQDAATVSATAPDPPGTAVFNTFCTISLGEACFRVAVNEPDGGNPSVRTPKTPVLGFLLEEILVQNGTAGGTVSPAVL